MGREIELKFDVDPGCGAAVRNCALLASAQQDKTEYFSVYFDTPRGALAKAGYSLRVRRSSKGYVQTAKRQTDAAAGLFDRAEWETAVQGLEPDLAALRSTPLAAILTSKRRKMLRPVVRTDFSRTRWLAGKNGSRVEIALDEGVATGGGDGQIGLLELELELVSGTTEGLFDHAESIAAEVPLRLGVMSKAERGQRFARGQLGQAVKAEPVFLRPGMNVAEGFVAIAYACFRHYRLNEMVLVEREDAAALHQARVAMRRLRSSFSMFGSVIRDAEHDRLRDELQWFTRQLGDARNFDVFIKRLRGKERTMRPGEAGVRDAIRVGREEAYARARSAIGSDRLRLLMLRLVRWLHAGAWREERKAGRPLAPFVAKRLDRRWSKVAAAGKHLAVLDSDPRHRLRIDIKKLRYACEFSAGLHGHVGERRKAFLAGLEELQEHLGELNDAETARSLIAALPLHSAEESAFSKSLMGREPDASACIAAAEKGFSRVSAAGPYWRD